MKVMVFQIGLHWCLILKLIELKEFIKLKIKVLFWHIEMEIKSLCS